MSELKSKRRLRPKKKTQPEHVAYPELESTLRKMAQIRNDALAGGKVFLELESWALQFMKDHGIETYDRGPYKATAVRPEGEVLDWDGLHDELDPAVWKQLLGEPQPQKDKLEALMQLGIVSADVVAKYLSTKPIKPHVKITARG